MRQLYFNITAALMLCFGAMANANIDDIPLPSDFEVRMAMNDDYPMIISGFVKQDLETVMQFYRDTLGEPMSISEDIGRYTYFYSRAGKQVKIGFYQQDQWCELSIMMTE